MATTKYSKTIDDITSLNITIDNLATMSMDELTPVTVQLANNAEADKLIKEFEDLDGNLAHEDGSIMGKYEAFHKFRS